uniref:Abnormal cell migration protein 18-like fibronectin type I domain-containing protein n=1 Tax=Ascaris lumbricoides TaxID=6252 RepID=A0A9J2PW63_ASCLU
MLYSVLLITLFAASSRSFQTDEKNSESAFVLFPHGADPQSDTKVIIPAVSNGPQPPFPCIVAEMGIHEHGQSFTKGNFHYKCNNGTSEVIACIADDKSVIHVGRMFIRNGVKHKCTVHGDTVTYEQESTCFENGVHYIVGDRFRNGSFQLVCQKDGISIVGCYIQNTDEIIPLGSVRVIAHYRHNCELLSQGKVRYSVNLIGCKKDDEFFNEGQIWTEKHIRYQCTSDGTLKVLGCVDEGGLFIELGRDVLMGGVVHRCYRIDKTTFYHRFHCEAHTLAECIAAAPSRRIRSLYLKQHETDK